MPKKRKASSSTQWPPLTFISSPDSQHPPVLTPDFAVDNPITAKSVFIEELSINAWVSPQFYQLRSQKNKSGVYAVNSKTDTQLLNKSKRHVNEADLLKKQNKYKQLKFLKNINEINSPSSILPCEKSIENSFRLEKCSTRTTDETHLMNEGPMIEPRVVDINTPMMEPQDPHLTPLSSVTQRRSHFRALKPHNLFGAMASENNETTPKDKHSLTNAEHVGHSKEMSENHDKLAITDLLTIKSLKPPQHKILVADTPECDYDLTFRQRQLKYGLRRQHDIGL
ncbi:unnamed protein product [Lymnaea stagnalis]|uniref:Uncharacterized protein n=1 Tax=Lymnaea stagnalis TaxID=6523 RepID=A0AAV2ICH0_LYMST